MTPVAVPDLHGHIFRSKTAHARCGSSRVPEQRRREVGPGVTFVTDSCDVRHLA
jgi:hypothetical protein